MLLSTQVSEQWQSLLLFYNCSIVRVDRLNEGYNILRTIVMAYGGISPDTPLTLSLSASRPTTRQTSSSLSSYELLIDDDGGTSNPGTAAVSSVVNLPAVAGVVPMSRSAPVAGNVETFKDNNRVHQQQLNKLAQSWSRPSTSTESHKEEGEDCATPHKVIRVKYCILSCLSVCHHEYIFARHFQIPVHSI